MVIADRGFKTPNSIFKQTPLKSDGNGAHLKVCLNRPAAAGSDNLIGWKPTPFDAITAYSSSYCVLNE
jgi:hypothetical protein